MDENEKSFLENEVSTMGPGEDARTSEADKNE